MKIKICVVMFFILFVFFSEIPFAAALPTLPKAVGAKGPMDFDRTVTVTLDEGGNTTDVSFKKGMPFFVKVLEVGDGFIIVEPLQIIGDPRPVVPGQKIRVYDRGYAGSGHGSSQKLSTSSVHARDSTTTKKSTAFVGTGLPAKTESSEFDFYAQRLFINTTAAWYRTFDPDTDKDGKDDNLDFFYFSGWGTYYFLKPLGLTLNVAHSYGEDLQRGIIPGAWRVAAGPSVRFRTGYTHFQFLIGDDIYDSFDLKGKDNHLILNPSLGFGIWRLYNEQTFEWNTVLDSIYFRTRHSIDFYLVDQVILAPGMEYCYMSFKQKTVDLEGIETEDRYYLQRVGVKLDIKFGLNYLKYDHWQVFTVVFGKTLAAERGWYGGLELSLNIF